MCVECATTQLALYPAQQMPRASYYPKSGNVPPRIQVQQVDLELVKKEVAARGGLAKVDQCREWRQIARAMVCMIFVCGMCTRGRGL